MKCKKALYGILLFNLVYLLPALWFSRSYKNYEFAIYIGVIIIAMAVIAYLYARFYISLPVLWMMSLWGLFHMAGGLMPVPESWPRGAVKPVLYNLWLIPGFFKFDHFVHMYGFGATTVLVWEVFSRILADAAPSGVSARPTVGLMLLCVFASMGLGALNEVIEFAATLILPETNVGGYINTGWDLVSNAAGAVLAAAAIYLSGGRLGYFRKGQS